MSESNLNPSPAEATLPDLRLIERQQLKEKFGITASLMTLKRWEKNGFPKRVRLNPGHVAWVENEVAAWLAARVAERAA